MVAIVNNSVVLRNNTVRLVPVQRAIKKPTTSNSTSLVKNIFTNLFNTKIGIEHELTQANITKARAGTVQPTGNSFVDSITPAVAKRPAPVPVGQPGKENELEMALQNAPRITAPRLSMNGPRR